MFTTPELRKCEAVIHTESVLLSPLEGGVALRLMCHHSSSAANDGGKYKLNCARALHYFNLGFTFYITQDFLDILVPN